MKVRIALIAIAGILAASLFTTTSVLADSHEKMDGGKMDKKMSAKKVDEITCEDFLAMDTTNQNRIAYWVDGYAQAKGEAAVGTVAFDKFGQPVGALVEDCKMTPKATLWEKMKKHL